MLREEGGEGGRERRESEGAERAQGEVQEKCRQGPEVCVRGARLYEAFTLRPLGALSSSVGAACSRSLQRESERVSECV